MEVIQAVSNISYHRIDEVYTRMKARGVRITSDNVEPINDRGGCGREFAFYDPDGRKIEISTWGT